MTAQELENIKYLKSNHFRELPVERQTEIVIDAVLNDPCCLKNIPKQLRSDQVVKMALNYDSRLILALDEDERTPELQSFVLRNSEYVNEEFIQQFPKELFNEDLYRIAAEKYPLVLQFMPDEFKTRETCDVALKNTRSYDETDVNVLRFVPYADVIYKNIDLLGDKYSPVKILECIPENVLDDKIIEWGLSRNGNCLACIPEDKRTDTMIEMAFRTSGLEPLRACGCLESKPEYIIAALTDQRSSFIHLPEELVTAEHCLLQEILYPDFFKYNPERLPERIKSGVNIYTLNQMVNKLSREKLSYEEAVNLFHGKSVQKGNDLFQFVQKSKEIKQTVMKPEESQRCSKGLSF